MMPQLRCTADTNEIELSLAVHDVSSPLELIAVFLDRWKCCDLILPFAAVNVAKVFLEQVAKVTLRFYETRCKVFKLGNFLWQAGFVVQLCSSMRFYDFMMNTLYAVLSSALIST